MLEKVSPDTQRKFNINNASCLRSIYTLCPGVALRKNCPYSELLRSVFYRIQTE